jgi:excisionase family DNA binding protein
MTEDKLLTPFEVADELGVGVRQVQVFISSGALPAIDLGHRTKRVRRSALDDFIAAREITV